MTISSETRTAGPFTGNGVTTAFPFTFKVFSEEDVLVVETDTDGVETTLTLTTDYTVTLNGNQDVSPGGTVTLNAALTDDYLLTLTSQVENLQEAQLTNNGGFYPAVINSALDRLTILVQQSLNKINRSVKIPLSDGTSVTTELPTKTARANKALVFDVDGDITISADDYDDQVATVAASASAASASAAAASASAAAALVSQNSASDDADLTALDVIQTAADVVSTGAAASAASASATLAEKFAGYKYTYSTTTTASDPGTGTLRLNNATLASATAMYISETTANSQGIAADIATWDDGTSTLRGRIRMVKQSDPAVFALFDVSGASTDNGTWQTLVLTYVAGNGSFSNSDAVSVGFVSKGDKGDTGATGTSIPLVAAGGTVDAITANYSPDITVADFAMVAFRSSGANTSTTPTFSPDGATARTIVKKGGQALVAGDIGASGSIHILQYESANTRWELLNPASSPSGGQTFGYDKATTQYYWIFGGSSSNFTVTAGRVYYIPVIIPSTRTVTDLVVQVKTLSAGNVRMGLYTDSGGVPSSLVYTAGTASTGTTGYKYINNSQSVTAGLYWIAVQFDATPAMEQIGNEANVVGGGFGATVLGSSNPPVQSPSGVGRTYYQTQAYASGLPSTASSLTMVTGNTMLCASVYCG